MAREWVWLAAKPRASASSVALGAYWARVRRLAWVRLAPVLAFTVLLTSVNILRSVAAIGLDSPLVSESLVPTATQVVLTYPAVLAAIVLTEALGLRGWRHLVVSTFGLSAAVAIVVGAMALVFGLANPVLVEAQVIVSDEAYIWRTFWIHVGGGMLLVAYLAFREREQAAAKAAQDANSKRATVERATAAARLKVMQARVEPELLFGALGDVRELYLRDRAAADTLLDDLIAYLRAALPQMRADASTLGREAAFAVAYAKIQPAARRGDLIAESAIPELAQGLPFPPMVLLPLVRAAAESSASMIMIETEGEPATGIVVRVEPPRTADLDAACLEAARAAVVNGFGPGASLDVDGRRAIVRWP